MVNASVISKQARILSVEDDPDINIVLNDFLENEGYAVDMVATGTEAMNLVKNQHYDAVLLDVRLPDLDGWLVLKQLMDIAPNLPVILHTAQSVFDSKVSNPTLYRAFAYITKPFNRQELKCTVKRTVAPDTHHDSGQSLSAQTCC